jgi:hypothetical protein
MSYTLPRGADSVRAGLGSSWVLSIPGSRHSLPTKDRIRVGRGRSTPFCSGSAIAKEDGMGRDEDADEVDEQQDALDEDMTDVDEEGRPLPPPDVETTLGFEGSIEGL